MKVGKLALDRLQTLVLDQLQYRRSDVLVHAGAGEDTAVVDFGQEVCVISTDPITGAAEGIGELAVHVSCNDVAAAGAEPVGLQVLLLLPETMAEEQIAQIMTEMHQTAAGLGVEILGGHTEITSKVDAVVVSGTAIGRAPKEQYVTTGGARPGDTLVVTKGIGIEGTLIIGREFADLLAPFAVAELERFASRLSVVQEGLIAAKAGVSAMHDMTEGGLLGAAVEMALASGCGVELQRSQAEAAVDPLTKRFCSELELDPLALLSSGSMLIASASPDRLIQRLDEAGIWSCAVGTMLEDADCWMAAGTNGEQIALPASVEDALWLLYRRQEQAQ